MLHYKNQCGANPPAATGTATQAHNHAGFCGLVEAGCCTQSSATCPLQEGMDTIAKTCKDAEKAPVCISCVSLKKESAFKKTCDENSFRMTNARTASCSAMILPPTWRLTSTPSARTQVTMFQTCPAKCTKRIHLSRTECTQRYFTSLVENTKNLAQPTCSAMGTGASVDGARKMADKFAFKCAKNANGNSVYFP